MGFLAKVKYALVQNKFKRNGLNIIQDVTSEQLQSILADYVSEGWELGKEYYNQSSLFEIGECKIRRGQSTLLFKWNEHEKGTITGPQRIVAGLANQYQLSALSAPQR